MIKLCVLLFALISLYSHADTPKPSEEAATILKHAIDASARPPEDRTRDADRLPLETMAFFGLRDDMTVLDIDPGAGYYTRLLAPVLKQKGKFYLAVGTDYVASSLLKEPGYEHVNVISKKTTMHRPDDARHYVLGDLDISVRDVDMVTNFRVYHVFGAKDRDRLNRAIFKALRPGGIYAVIDHTARHGEPETEANRRRFDPVKAIAEIQAAGFILHDYSTLHYRPDDQLTLEVGDERVAGRTDRWALKFIKPVSVQ